MSNLHPDTKLPLCEDDLRMPEFRGAKLEDYEWRDDGKIVRKDRWETGMRRIAFELGFHGREGFEIDDVINKVRRLAQSADEKPEPSEVE